MHRRSSFRAVLLALCFSGLLSLSPAAADDVSVRARVQAAADPNAGLEVRQERLHDLVQLGPVATGAFVDLLDDPDANVRAVAAYTLGQISLAHGADVRTVDALIALLKREREPVVRTNAALALADVHDPKVVAPLAALLDADDLNLRRVAVVALSRTREPAAIPPLVRIFRQETDPEIRQNVVRGLGELRALEVLVELQQSVERESPLWWDIEAQLRSPRGATVTERRRQPQVTMSKAGALYFLLIRARPYLLAVAFVLLSAPAVVAGIWSLARMGPERGIVRLAVAASAAVLALFFGGIASLPGFALELQSHDPSGPPLMLMPFRAAMMTLPVVLCSCFVTLRLPTTPGNTVLHAAIWAGLYGALQFGSWHLIPSILNGHYFFFGMHPGWHATQIGYVAGAAVACTVAAVLIRVADRHGNVDGIESRTSLVVALPCGAVLGVGYLILNLYSY